MSRIKIDQPLFSSPSQPDDKIFRLSLVVSLLAHVIVLASLFYANIHYFKRFEKNMEIIYQAALKEAPPPKDPARRVRSIRRPPEKIEPEILSHQEKIPLPRLKESRKKIKKVNPFLGKKELRSSSEGKRFVSVPMLNSTKISNPKYLNYHERIRSKIRDRAYVYVDSPEFETGEVYLTFVLLSDGALRDVKIHEDKTQANDYLKDVGLRSIRDSSPFPPFPEDLQYPELTFNVVISFKISE